MDFDDLLSLSPSAVPNSILKPSCGDNFIVLQTPVHKNLKVSFQTPSRASFVAQTVLPNIKSTSKPSESSDWNILRQLDDELKWKERIEVVTKFDHQDHLMFAKEFLDDIITLVVEQNCPKSTSDVMPSTGQSTTSNYDESQELHNLTSVDKLGQNLSETSVCDDKENVKPAKGCIKSTSKLKGTSRLRKPGVGKKGIPRNSSTAETEATTSDGNLSAMKSGFDNLDELDSINPFQSKLCLENSPVSSTHKEPRSPKKDDKWEMDNFTYENPFESKNCLENSPISSLFSSVNPRAESVFNPTNPFETKNCLANSPITTLFVSDELAVAKDKQNFEKEQFEIIETESPNKGNVCANSGNMEVNLPAESINVDEDSFKDATSLVKQGFDFDLDFLEAKGYDYVSSDLRKQSLYVKFDPLVGGEEESAGRSLIGRKSDIIDLTGHVGLCHFSNPPMPEEVKVQPDFLCDSPSKFTKDMDSKPVDIPPPSASTDHEASDAIVQVLKYSETDVEKIRKPILEKNEELEVKMRSHEDQLNKMRVVLEEFEDTVIEMTQKHEHEIAEQTEMRENLTKENEKMQSHLESVEKAYLELLQRCEQMKTVISNYKINEETYKKVFAEYKSAQELSQQRYKALKATLEESQQKLHQEFDCKENDYKSQITGLKARCNFLENQAKSAQSQLEQKTTENNELTKICDELIEQQQGRNT